MTSEYKIIDYIRVYQDRKIIDGVLYPRHFIHQDKPIGIPNGISFYRKNEYTKYVRLTSTATVSGMSIRYDSKDTQIGALLKLIKIKDMQSDTCATTSLRNNKRRTTKQGINTELPSGVRVMSRKINNNVYNRVIANVFKLDKNKFCPVHIHAGRADDPVKLEQAIKKAIEMRNESMALVASITQVTRSRVV